MDNQIICKILNKYAYRQRINWDYTYNIDQTNQEYSSFGYDWNGGCLYVDEFTALAVAEKLIKQSSDDDLKTIVLSITKPLQGEISKLEKELASFRANAIALLQAQSEFRHPAFIKVTEEGFTVTGIETKPDKPIELLDVVILLEDLPDYKLFTGSKGTVVEVLERNPPKFDIEFVTENNLYTLAYAVDGRILKGLGQ